MINLELDLLCFHPKSMSQKHLITLVNRTHQIESKTDRIKALKDLVCQAQWRNGKLDFNNHQNQHTQHVNARHKVVHDSSIQAMIIDPETLTDRSYPCAHIAWHTQQLWSDFIGSNLFDIHHDHDLEMSQLKHEILSKSKELLSSYDVNQVQLTLFNQQANTKDSQAYQWTVNRLNSSARDIRLQRTRTEG